MIESLEPRRMLAVFTATSGNDAISIQASGGTTTVVINAVPVTTSDTSIIVNCGDGADNIFLFSTRAGTTLLIHGEGGADSLGDPSGNLDTAFQASVTFDAGNTIGDEFVANNTAGSNTLTDYDITADRINKNQSTFISYSGLEKIRFHDSDGSNRIGFSALQGSASHNISELLIEGRGGDDTISNTLVNTPSQGSWATSEAFAGVTIDGGNGNDLLLLSDALNQFDGTGETWALESSSVDVTTLNNAPLNYLNFERTEVLSSPFRDRILLNDKPAAMQLYFDSSDGDDDVVPGGGDIFSNGWGLTTLIGGTGNDFIRFDDVLNPSGGTCTFDNFTLTRASSVIQYSSFETQRLDASELFDASHFSIPNTINLNAFSGQIGSTTISAVGNRSTTINVAQGSLVNISGALTLTAPGATVNIKDQTGTSGDNYTLAPSQFIKTNNNGTSIIKTIDYSSPSVVTLNANQGSNKITINSTPAGRTTTVNDFGGGSNAYYLGGGNIGANLLGPVTINGAGSAGSNGVVLDNSLDTSPSTQTLNGGAFTDGQTHNISNVTSIYLLDGGGGGTLDVLRTTIGTNIFEAFNKVVTVGNGNMDANLVGGCTINGAASVTVDDRLDTGNDTYVVDGFQSNDNVSFRKTSGAGATVGLNFCGTNTLQCNPSDNVITVNNTGPGVQIFGNGGNDRFDVLNTKPNFFSPTPTILGIDTGAENPSIPTVGDTLNISGNSTVQLLNDDVIRSLNITGGNAKFIIPTGVACKAQTVSLTGVIDLAGGSLLSLAGGPTQATFRNWIINGRNNGAWNGTSTSGAINSSLAASTSQSDGVGYGLGSQIAPTTIGSFAIGASDTLLRYTLDGDANLDHAVNSVDFNILVANFGQLAKVWTQSDFNYDGSTNSVDFNMMSSNFGGSLAAPDSAIRQGQRFSGTPITSWDELNTGTELLFL